MIKLIATDMDGTFLTADHTFDRERFTRLLKRFEEAGMLFVVASGRSLLSLEKLFSGYLDRIALIAENGGVVSYKGQVLFEQFITKEQYLPLVAYLQNLVSCEGFLLSGKNGAYARLEVEQAYFDHISNYYDHLQKADFTLLQDDVYKLTARIQPDKVNVVSQDISQRFSGVRAVVTGFGGIDIIPEHLNKARGLEVLCRHLTIQAREVLAFGDNDNDLEMLTFAGKGLATANARDGVKAVSDAVIGHCNDSAVLNYLENLMNRQ